MRDKVAVEFKDFSIHNVQTTINYWGGGQGAAPCLKQYPDANTCHSLLVYKCLVQPSGLVSASSCSLATFSTALTAAACNSPCNLSQKINCKLWGGPWLCCFCNGIPWSTGCLNVGWAFMQLYLVHQLGEGRGLTANPQALKTVLQIEPSTPIHGVPALKIISMNDSIYFILKNFFLCVFS